MFVLRKKSNLTLNLWISFLSVRHIALEYNKTNSKHENGHRHDQQRPFKFCVLNMRYSFGVVSWRCFGNLLAMYNTIVQTLRITDLKIDFRLEQRKLIDEVMLCVNGFFF